MAPVSLMGIDVNRSQSNELDLLNASFYQENCQFNGSNLQNRSFDEGNPQSNDSDTLWPHLPSDGQSGVNDSMTAQQHSHNGDPIGAEINLQFILQGNSMENLKTQPI
jgi:hypothetical protein